MEWPKIPQIYKSQFFVLFFFLLFSLKPANISSAWMYFSYWTLFFRQITVCNHYQSTVSFQCWRDGRMCNTTLRLHLKVARKKYRIEPAHGMDQLQYYTWNSWKTSNFEILLANALSAFLSHWICVVSIVFGTSVAKNDCLILVPNLDSAIFQTWA